MVNRALEAHEEQADEASCMCFLSNLLVLAYGSTDTH